MTTSVHPPEPRLLRLQAVAERCDVSLRTVQAWVAAGRLRVLRFGSRCVRVAPDELEHFLAEAAGRAS